MDRGGKVLGTQVRGNHICIITPTGTTSTLAGDCLGGNVNGQGTAMYLHGLSVIHFSKGIGVDATG